MGSFSGPGIVVSNLLLSVDCGNTKSYDRYENLLTNSEQINNWSTTVGSTTVTTDINSISTPIGSFTADKLIGANTISGRQSRYLDISVLPNTKYTFSVFLKAAERRYATIWFDHESTALVEGAYVGASSYIDLQTGVRVPGFGTATNIVSYPNGWYRVYVSATTSATFTGSLRIQIGIGTPNNTSDGAGSAAYQYTGDGTSGIYVWGAQLEEGANLTDYFSTTSTAKSRGTQLSNQASTSNNFSLNNPLYYEFSGSNGGVIDFNRTMPPTAEDISYAQLSGLTGSLSASSYLLNDHTTEVWFKSDNRNPTGYTTTPAGGEAESAIVVYYGFHSMWYYSAVAYKYSIWGNKTDPYTLTFNDTSSNVWTQLVAVRNNNVLTLYKNGVLQATQSISSNGIDTVSKANNVIRIGVGNTAASDYTWGADMNFAILRMYNKGLTQSEVLQNFNATRGRFGI